MLVTFIISQNRNIPAIRRSVELLAAQCGERRIDSRGTHIVLICLSLIINNIVIPFSG